MDRTESGSGRARALGFQRFVCNAELLLDLCATQPLLLRDEVPAEDAEDRCRSKDHARLNQDEMRELV